MLELRKDERGVFAIEFALLMPVCLFALGYAINIGQLLQIKQATQFSAIASAASGARALNQQAGALANAQNIAQATFTANAALFLKNTTATFGGCAGIDAAGAQTDADGAAVALDCSVSASAPALFPIGWSSVSQNAEARS